MTRPEHYRFYSAVFPILLRSGPHGQEVLLHLRQNTGYMDGHWDFAGSGHVDENETARQAVARECREELGIMQWTPPTRSLSTCATGSPAATAAPITTCASRSGATAGEPAVMEPEKNAGLHWFPVTDALPEHISSAVEAMLRPLPEREPALRRGHINDQPVTSTLKKEEHHHVYSKGKRIFQAFGIEDRIREFDVSSATVELAAVAVGVEGARIAKSMSFKIGEEPIIIVMAGDAKVDNSRYKAQFHTKAKMLTFDEAHTMIGHDPGGVCSFALPDNVKTYLDISLKRFDTVFPAAGSSNSAIELTCDELEKYSSNFVAWIDVSKGWRPEEKERQGSHAEIHSRGGLSSGQRLCRPAAPAGGGPPPGKPGAAAASCQLRQPERH